MDVFKCVAVEHLPAGVPVAITQVGHSVYVYLSKEYDLDTLMEALEAASNIRHQRIVSLRS